MKKTNLIAIMALIFSCVTLHAQDATYDDPSTSKFSFVTYGGIGYAVVDNDREPNYNLNASTADFLINYRIGKRYGIATGLGFSQLSGNGFSAGGNFYHERGLIKIPLLFSSDYNLSEKVRLVANIGFYGQGIIKDEYSFTGGVKAEDVYTGWNFGLQCGIGLAYNLNEKMSLGIMVHNQADFTRIDSDSSKGVTDEQKISGLNSIGLLFAINL